MAAKKATFSLSTAILAAMDEAVAKGAAPSKNALVERAIGATLREWRRQERLLRWEQAANDPLMLRDIEETEMAFQSADAESARRIR